MSNTWYADYLKRRAECWRDAKDLAADMRRRAARWRERGDHEQAAQCEQMAARYDKLAGGA